MQGVAVLLKFSGLRDEARRDLDNLPLSDGTHPPTHSPPGGPNLPGLFSEMSVAAPVPIRGEPGWGFKSDQPLGSLCAPTRAGHNFDSEGG